MPKKKSEDILDNAFRLYHQGNIALARAVTALLMKGPAIRGQQGGSHKTRWDPRGYALGRHIRAVSKTEHRYLPFSNWLSLAHR